MTDIFSQFVSFHLCVAFVAKSPSSISDETGICELFFAYVTQETLYVPICVHCFNDTSDNKFATFSAARCKKYMKVMFAILATFKFVEYSISKFLETLSTSDKKKIIFDFKLASKLFNKNKILLI